jgi:hypothetical protein
LKWLAAALLVGALSGCAVPPPAFPERSQVLVAVSAPVAAQGSRIIPNSHVSLSYLDTDSGVRSIYPTLGGLLGGTIGGAVGSFLGSRIHPTPESRFTPEIVEPALTVRVDGVLTQRLRAAGVPMGNTGDLRATLVLIPVTEVVASLKTATVACRLEARYGGGAHPDPFVQRRYEFTARPRPLLGSGEGWVDNGGDAFKREVEVAFSALADAFAADWNGRFATGERMRRVRWQSTAGNEPREARLLYETADFAMLASGSADAPIATQVTVVERSALLD